MRTRLGALIVAAVTAVCFSATAPAAHAQVSIGVHIGAAPVCPYGYYDYAPYPCAPYGYYGPEWFNGGVFIGAGPWFHGPSNFHGHVDNHFDPHHGYKGPMPKRGERPESNRQPGRVANFKGNEEHDGHGHVVHGK
ncbi:MAG: hypothetical protein WBC92_00060 [Terracidiphilus sp.]